MRDTENVCFGVIGCGMCPFLGVGTHATSNHPKTRRFPSRRMRQNAEKWMHPKKKAAFPVFHKTFQRNPEIFGKKMKTLKFSKYDQDRSRTFSFMDMGYITGRCIIGRGNFMFAPDPWWPGCGAAV